MVGRNITTNLKQATRWAGPHCPRSSPLPPPPRTWLTTCCCWNTRTNLGNGAPGNTPLPQRLVHGRVGQGDSDWGGGSGLRWLRWV